MMFRSPMFRSFAWLFAVAALAGFGCDSQSKVQTYSVPKDAEVPVASRPSPVPESAPTAPASSGGDRVQAQASPSPGMNALPGMAEQAQSFGEPAWTAPKGWVAQPLGSVRKGSWKIEGEGGEVADVSVTVFPGDVGGDLANVNRWRRQVGLGPIGSDQLAPMLEHRDVGDTHGHVVMIEGPRGDSILGAMVPRGPGTWFVKLSGPTALVESQRKAFDQFLDSVQFPSDG